MILKITNTTAKSFEQHYNYKGRERFVSIPKYALMHEVEFSSKEEADFFIALIKQKLDSKILHIGKMGEGDAQKTNEKVAKEEAKQKADLLKEQEENFQKEAEANLGTNNASVKVEIKKGKQ